MAIMALRLRRAVTLARKLSTYSHVSFYSSAAVIKNSPATPIPTGHSHLCGFNHQSLLASRWTVSRCRVSNSGSVYSPLDSNSSGERPTLFPGCDYNHWLVTMEWPDPQPTREEKIDCFVKTLANVVGSEEEAKKEYMHYPQPRTKDLCVRFQRSLEKIKKEPGVEWVLPDSYGDPINKTYGVGDKYINGVIIPDTKIYNNRSTGRDRPRNRRRDSMPVERRDVQVSRNPLPPVDVKDTTVEMSMKGDGQDQRSAVDGRSPFTSNQQDHGLPPMSGRGQDYRTPTMDGRGSDYRPPPIDGRGQDYRTPPMDGRGQDYRPPPVDGRGQEYRSPPIDGRGQAYRSPSMDGTGQGYMSMPMNERGQDYRSPPIEGRGQEYYRPPPQMEGHNSYYSSSPVEGRGQDYYRPQPRDVRGSDYYTQPPIDGTGQDYRSPPMQGRWQDYRPPPMDGRGQDYRSPPMDGRGQDYRSPPVDGRGQDYRSPQLDGGRMQGYYNQPPVASGQGQDYYRPPPMDGVSGQDYRPSALDGRGQDYRSSMDRRDPVPSGDWQGHRASMDGRGPTMQEDQQGNRSPVNNRGPILGERRDFVPPREVMQGQQSNIMGPERNTPGQRE